MEAKKVDLMVEVVGQEDLVLVELVVLLAESQRIRKNLRNKYFIL
jgi:hypothetical protein